MIDNNTSPVQLEQGQFLKALSGPGNAQKQWSVVGGMVTGILSRFPDMNAMKFDIDLPLALLLEHVGAGGFFVSGAASSSGSNPALLAYRYDKFDFRRCDIRR